jgi:hypothetical protein
MTASSRGSRAAASLISEFVFQKKGIELIESNRSISTSIFYLRIMYFPALKTHLRRRSGIPKDFRQYT